MFELAVDVPFPVIQLALTPVAHERRLFSQSVKRNVPVAVI